MEDQDDLDEENRQKLEKSKDSLLNSIHLLTGAVEKLNKFTKEEKIMESVASLHKVNEEISQVCYIVEMMETAKRDQIEKMSHKNHRMNTLKLELRKQTELIEALENENQDLLQEAENDRIRLKELLEENEVINEELKSAENGVKEKLEKFENGKNEAEQKLKKSEIQLKAAEKKNKWLWKTIDKFKIEKKKLKTKIKELEEKEAGIVNFAQSEVCGLQPGNNLTNPISQSELIQVSQIENSETEEKLKQSIEEIKDLSAKLNCLKSKYGKILSENEIFSEENPNLKKRIEELDALELSNKLKIEELSETVENKIHRISKLESELEKEKKRYTDFELKYQEMEHTLKLAKVEATKQLLMPRISMLKRTTSGRVGRRSSIPNMENVMENIDGDESDELRNRAYTITEDIRHSRPEASELLKTEETKQEIEQEVEPEGDITPEEMSPEKLKMQNLEEKEEEMRRDFGLNEEDKPDPRKGIVNYRNSIRDSIAFVNSNFTHSNLIISRLLSYDNHNQIPHKREQFQHEKGFLRRLWEFQSDRIFDRVRRQGPPWDLSK